MKKLSLTLLCLSSMAFFTLGHAQIKTPAPSPASKLTQTVGLTDITVDYSRPSKSDREIFGKLVPYGEMWRTGANKNTMISFSEDVKIGGKDIKKGNYAIFTVPNKASDWEIILYTDTENWGTPENYDATKEAVRLKAKPQTLSTAVETFTIDVNNIDHNSCTVYLLWDNTSVSFDVNLLTDDQVAANMKRVFDGPTADDYYQAGRYLLSSGGDATKAYDYLKKSNEMEPKFWRLRHESLALAKLGQYKKAIEVAERSMAMAKEAGNDQYVKFNTESIAEWSAKK